MHKFISLAYRFSCLLLVVVFSFSIQLETVHAAQIPPQIFTYQGRLTDSSGNLLGGSGTTYYLKYSIWNNPTVGSGSRVWPVSAPTSVGTTVKQGVFTVNIGDTANGYPDTLNLDYSNNSSLYLQVEVSSNNSSWETLSPRQQLTSAAFAQVAGAVVGTAIPSTFGTTTSVANSFVTIAATSSDSIPLSIIGVLNQAANLFQIQNSAGTNLFSVNATGGMTAVAATTTSLFSTTASSTNLFTSNLSIGSLSGILKATAGVVTTALVNLASDVTGILSVANGGTSTSTAPTYGQLLVGNANGTYTYMATSTLGLGGSSGTVASIDVSGGSTGLTTSGGAVTSSGVITLGGVLNIANGGTGLTAVGASSTVMTTNGSVTKWNRLATSQLTNDSGFLTSLVGAASSTLLADFNTFTNLITGSISGNAGTVTNGVYTTTFNNLFDNRLS
ncbi:MAG: hypothetical protein WAW90_03295, partial [Minisyncoccia bacterium]